MASHSSASKRRETPHANKSTENNTLNLNQAISPVKRRAEYLLKDDSIEPQTRTVIYYCLQINDPCLAELVRRVEAGETILDIFPDRPPINADDSSKAKIEALAEIICCSSSEAAAALLVLMGTLQDSTHPEALANLAKHFAFTHCGEMNFNGMVDAQIPILEGELLAGTLAA